MSSESTFPSQPDVDARHIIAQLVVETVSFSVAAFSYCMYRQTEPVEFRETLLWATGTAVGGYYAVRSTIELRQGARNE